MEFQNFTTALELLSSSHTASDTQPNNWLTITLTGSIIIGTWLANCILLGGALQTASSGRIVPVVYFFIGSQAIASLLHVTLNLPQSIIGLLFGSPRMKSYVHIFCLYSTYLDTMFCNLTFLQTFFASLDAYLRLRNPVFYMSSAKRRPALWLKVGSPWLVASLQAIGQLALSEKNHIQLHEGSNPSTKNPQPTIFNNLRTVCIFPDPNFLIIRTAIAYALPLITCIVLVGLQLRSLRNLKNYSDDSLEALMKVRKTFTRTRLHSNLTHQIQGDMIQKISTNHAKNDIALQHMNSSKFSTVNENKANDKLMSESWSEDRKVTLETLISDGTSTWRSQQLKGTTSHSIPHLIYSTHSGEQLVPSLHALSLTDPFQSVSVHTCPAHGLVNISKSHDSTMPKNLSTFNSMVARDKFDTLSVIQSTTQPKVDTIPSPFKNYTRSLSAAERKPDSSRVVAKDNALWLTAYHGEQLAVAINLVSCIIAVGTWSPYILATLANGLCQPLKISPPIQSTITFDMEELDPGVYEGLRQPKFIHRCLIQVTADRIADFHWWAYASVGLLLPCLLFFLDLGLREGCWKALNYSDRNSTDQDTFLSLDPILNSFQTYRCANRSFVHNVDHQIASPLLWSRKMDEDDTDVVREANHNPPRLEHVGAQNVCTNP